MIIDLEQFISQERPIWDELESMLKRLQSDPFSSLSYDEGLRLHYLYERVSADLARLGGAGAELETRTILESLVARAYGEIHEERRKPGRLVVRQWLVYTAPRVFRRHARAFALAVAVTVLGAVLGGTLIAVDPSSREIITPYAHLVVPPSVRVEHEESESAQDRLRGGKLQGVAFYAVHNTRVTLATVAAGITWGIGSALLLLGNGVLLGAIVMDYVLDGQGLFVLAWLLPHGSVEIPAVLIGGQAAFVLASAVIGKRSGDSFRERLRAVTPDIISLIGLIVILLGWAAIIEACLSQYHEPVLPYALKVALGGVQLVLLTLYLARCGRKEQT